MHRKSAAVTGPRRNRERGFVLVTMAVAAIAATNAVPSAMTVSISGYSINSIVATATLTNKSHQSLMRIREYGRQCKNDSTTTRREAVTYIAGSYTGPQINVSVPLGIFN